VYPHPVLTKMRPSPPPRVRWTPFCRGVGPLEAWTKLSVGPICHVNKTPMMSSMESSSTVPEGPFLAPRTHCGFISSISLFDIFFLSLLLKAQLNRSGPRRLSRTVAHDSSPPTDGHKPASGHELTFFLSFLCSETST